MQTAYLDQNLQVKVATISAMTAWLLPYPPLPARAHRRETFSGIATRPLDGAGGFVLDGIAAERESSLIPLKTRQHPVIETKPFAVGQFALTFDNWDARVVDGGCKDYMPNDEGGAAASR